MERERSPQQAAWDKAGQWCLCQQLTQRGYAASEVARERTQNLSIFLVLLLYVARAQNAKWRWRLRNKKISKKILKKHSQVSKNPSWVQIQVSDHKEASTWPVHWGGWLWLWGTWRLGSSRQVSQGHGGCQEGLPVVRKGKPVWSAGQSLSSANSFRLWFHESLKPCSSDGKKVKPLHWERAEKPQAGVGGWRKRRR